MGKGNRGFKPQGIANPIMLARMTRPVQTGPTIRERLDRERPSWQDLKAAVQRKEKSSSDYLEQYENENFKKELIAFREMKRGDQEKLQLEEVAKRCSRIGYSDDDSSSASVKESSRHQRSSKNHRKKRERTEETDRSQERSQSKRKRSNYDEERSSHKKRRRRSRSRERRKKETDFNPHKMSNFMKMAEHM